MVGTGMSCPALHSGHLPVLFQHRASVSLHPVGSVPTTATPGKRGEVTRRRHHHPSPGALRGPCWQRLRLEKPSSVRRAGLPSRKKTAREGCATSAAGHPFLPHGVLLASTGATERWHDDGPHREWASPLASRPHPCALCQPAEGFTARCRWPGSPPARGCHCRRHQQVLALSLFDPVPAAGRSAPRDRCLAKSPPAVPAPASICGSTGSARAPSGVSGRKRLRSTPAGLRGGEAGGNGQGSRISCAGVEAAGHGIYPCHRMREQHHWLLDTCIPNGNYLTRRTLMILWGPVG